MYQPESWNFFQFINSISSSSCSSYSKYSSYLVKSHGVFLILARRVFPHSLDQLQSYKYVKEFLLRLVVIYIVGLRIR